MTDKTCSTCIWYDKYFDQNYGFCRDRQIWVDGNKKDCEVHSNGKAGSTGTQSKTNLY